MKTVILCGGKGTRLGKHGESIPKGLIEIGGYPILWHLLKLYKHYGFNDFILCLGYLGDEIKNYFSNEKSENFNVTFADTGLETNTGGRIKKIKNLIGNDESFFVTYGDGLANVNLNSLLAFHKTNKTIGTLTAIHPMSPFGLIKLDENDSSVTEFQEKPKLNEWINGGFFVFNKEIFSYLEENSILEREPLEKLSKEKQLKAYKHEGFWKCMDTYKDNLEFNKLWKTNNASWKIW